MTHAVIDPELLGLPDDFLDWVAKFETWESLLADSPLAASCPAESRREAYGQWCDYPTISAKLAAQDCPLSVHDLLRVLDAVLGRLRDDPLPNGYDVLFGRVDCIPSYAPAGASRSRLSDVIEHLGRAAVCRAHTKNDVGVLTRESSWSSRSETIAIDGTIVLRQVGDNEPEDPTPDDGAFRELLHVWTDAEGLLKTLAQRPCTLLSHPSFAVRAHAVGMMGCDDGEVSITFGPAFADSVAKLNYVRDERRAAALLRTMTMLALGRAAEVPGHRERKGSGANNAVVEDREGFEIERSYLAQKSPNAHRLFWVRRPVPHILNVGGHESRPIL
jgi:hypothetical protein